jgi:hypothetical protein
MHGYLGEHHAVVATQEHGRVTQQVAGRAVCCQQVAAGKPADHLVRRALPSCKGCGHLLARHYHVIVDAEHLHTQSVNCNLVRAC